MMWAEEINVKLIKAESGFRNRLYFTGNPVGLEFG